MREIKLQQVSYITRYKAFDGLEFDSSDECIKYERSAKGMLLAKYKDFNVKTISEYELFSCGNEDSNVDIVKITSEDRLNVILQLLHVFNDFSHDDDDKVFKIYSSLKQALESKDCVVIYRGYENDSFWYEGSINDIIQNIKDQIKNVGN